jgi:transposase
MTAPAREVIRAKVLLHYANGTDISRIKHHVGISRPAIYKCIDKALAAGCQAGLKDTYHSPREPEILDDAKAWVVSLACTKPKDHGLAAELWTLSALARYVAKHAVEAGFPRLTSAVKATVWRILNEKDIKPHRIQ